MPKKLEISSSSAEFLILQIYWKENGVLPFSKYLLINCIFTEEGFNQ